MKFKSFLINENKAYFAQRSGDILNAIQDLNQNSDGMGLRQLMSNAHTVVNQIRRMLHTHWSDSDMDDLKVLQKCGVAIMKTIEEKGDLRAILSTCQQQIEEILGDKESPINDIGSEQEA